MEIICLKAPGIYSGQFWSNNFAICLWRKPDPYLLWFLDFLNCPRAPEPTIFIFGDPWIPPKSKKTPGTLLNNNMSSQIFGSPWFWMFLEKAGAETWWNILDMRSISSSEHEMDIWKSVKLWNQEARNFETKKPRNQSTLKPRNRETLKPRNQNTKEPSPPAPYRSTYRPPLEDFPMDPHDFS